MKSSILACFLFLSYFSFAQEPTDSFQIKHYKYRTPGFRALTLDFRLNGSVSNSGIVDSSKNNQNQISLSPSSFSFYKVSSTDKKFHESYYLFSVNGSTNRSTLNKEVRKNSNLNGSFIWNVKNQYFLKNNWFYEIQNNFQVLGGKNKFNFSTSKFDYAELQLSEEPAIGIGRGRVEFVQDAQMALFILNDLEKQGLLSASPTNIQKREFATLITDINNQRIFDFRRKRIYELQRIDSFLKLSGLSTVTDIRHFTTVNDNWNFANAPFRKNGSQLFFRLKPGITLIRNNSGIESAQGPDESKTKQFNLQISPEVGFETNSAMSLQWQQNFSVSLSYRTVYVDKNTERKFGSQVEEGDLTYWQKSAEAKALYSLGFYPNTRTYIIASLGTSLLHGNLLLNRDKGIISNSNFNLETSYFLGYRTRLNASIGVNYATQDIGFFPGEKFREYGFNTGFFVGINHSIF